MNDRKIIYVDMDNTIVDFKSAFSKIDKQTLYTYKENLDNIPNIFSMMEPIEGAIEGVKRLSKKYDVYLLSTAPWDNPSAWADKIIWVRKYLPKCMYKKLILSHNKHLNIGDYLLDDRKANGADKFTGIHLQYGVDENVKDWESVVEYFNV